MVVEVPQLDFSVVGAEADRMAASPTVRLRLRVEETTGTKVHAIALRCQVRIEPLKRQYGDHEAEALLDLFGERHRWGDTLKTMQLAFLSHMIPSFTGTTEVDLFLPCSYDFDVAANKYLHALDDGEIPLTLMFNGTVFTSGPAGVAVEPVPWHKECALRLPVEVYREAMDLHFPGTAWLRLGRESFDALHRYRARQGLTSWDDAIERLLKEAQP